MKEITTKEQATELLKRRQVEFDNFGLSLRWCIWEGRSWRQANKNEEQLLESAYLSLVQTELEEFKKQKNDPYAYYEGEIEAVGTLRTNADKHIEFLLYLLRKSSTSAFIFAEPPEQDVASENSPQASV